MVQKYQSLSCNIIRLQHWLRFNIQLNTTRNSADVQGPCDAFCHS